MARRVSCFYAVTVEARRAAPRIERVSGHRGNPLVTLNDSIELSELYSCYRFEIAQELNPALNLAQSEMRQYRQ